MRIARCGLQIRIDGRWLTALAARRPVDSPDSRRRRRTRAWLGKKAIGARLASSPKEESREPTSCPPGRVRSLAARAAAVLLAAVAALLALPLQAQAQTEVWPGTLTVRDSAGVLGCSNGFTNNFCSVHLSDDDFTHDSTDYAITTIFLRTNGRLEIVFDTNLTTATQALTLNVDGTAFAFEDADFKSSTERRWNNSGLSWTAGDTVSLTLTTSAVTTAPTVSSVALTSDPNDDDRDGDDATYAIGDTIQATVTFSADVTVTGTPQLTLDVGGTDKTADYSATDSTATQLVFAYTVATNDADTDGIAIAANQLALNGGTIKAGTTDAVLTHAAVAADADHKVDGVRPTLVSAETSTDGTTVTLTFSETISSADHLQITVTASTRPRPTGATVNGATVVLTVNPALRNGEAITLILNLNVVRDAVGNGNVFSGGSNNPVTNNVVDALAVTGVEITSDPGSDDNYVTDDPIEVTVTFGSAMTVDITNGVPRIQLSLTFGSATPTLRWAGYVSGSGTTALVFRYTVVAGDESAAAGIRVSGNSLELNLGTIEDSSNTAAVLGHTTVARDAGHRVNFAYPALLFDPATSMDGATIVLTYDEDLVEATNFTISRYALKVNNAAATLMTDTFAVVSGRTVTLTLTTAVTAGQTVTLSYTDAAGDQPTVIEDRAGNDAQSFTDRAVTNTTGDITAPMFSTATVDGTSLVITFDEALAAAASLANDAFEVKKTSSSTESTVTLSSTSPAISGATVTLTLATAVVSTDTEVKVRYTKPDSGSNNTLVDANGNEVATFPDEPVTNNTGAAAATVTSVSLTSTPPYFTDDVIEVSVVFSEAVTVTTPSGMDPPSHEIGIDPHGPIDAPYARGTGTDTLVFAHTVVAADQDDDGVFLRDGATDGALKLNDGTITARGVAAVVNAYGGRARHDDHTVNVEPTITAIAVTSSPVTGDTYDTGEKIEISVTFSAAVDVTDTGTPSLTFNLGNSGSSVRTAAPYDRGSGTTVLVFAYAVQAGDEDDNGIFLYNDGNSDLGGDGVISLSTSMIVAKDTTTAANIAFASGGGLQASHKVDGTTTTSAATVTSVSLTSTPPYFTDDVIEVSVVFSEAVTVTTPSGMDPPSHEIGIDPHGPIDAPYARGTGTDTLVFAHTVVAADQDDDGVFLRDGATDGDRGDLEPSHGGHLRHGREDRDLRDLQRGGGRDGHRHPVSGVQLGEFRVFSADRRALRQGVGHDRAGVRLRGAGRRRGR